jgi:hypothetical protein
LSFRGICGRLGIAETQRSHASTLLPPEFEQRVAADRNPNHRRAAYIRIVHYAGNVGRMLRHRGRAFANIRVAVPTEIRHDEAVSRGQRLRDRQPKFMISGKGMQKDNRRPIPKDPINNFRVAALDSLHAADLITERRELSPERS